MLKEIRTRGDIVLFIDELHTLVGAGAAEGAIDAASILKRCCPRRAPDHRRHDHRRVPQAPGEGRGARAPFSAHQGGAAERLADDRDPEGPARPGTSPTTPSPSPIRHWWPQPTWPTATWPTGYLPDKAIDLIDEAGSRLRIRRMTTPPAYKKLEEEITRLRTDKESAIEKQAFDQAKKLAEQEKDRLDAKEAMEAEWRAEGVDLFDVVDEEVNRRGAGQLDGYPRLPPHRGGDRQAVAHGGRTPQAGHRTGAGDRRSGPLDPSHPRRPEGPQAPERLVHLPRPDRRGEDRAGQDAGRVPVRR